MSWWDSSSFSSFASQALKNAQKKIDKVLDIKDSEKDDTEQESNEASLPKPENKASSWNTWLGGTEGEKDKGAQEEKEEGEEEEEEGRSSWSMPWGMDTSFTKQFSPSALTPKSESKTKSTDAKTSKSLLSSVKAERSQKVERSQKIERSQEVERKKEERTDTDSDKEKDVDNKSKKTDAENVELTGSIKEDTEKVSKGEELDKCESESTDASGAHSDKSENVLPKVGAVEDDEFDTSDIQKVTVSPPQDSEAEKETRGPDPNVLQIDGSQSVVKDKDFHVTTSDKDHETDFRNLNTESVKEEDTIKNDRTESEDNIHSNVPTDGKSTSCVEETSENNSGNVSGTAEISLSEEVIEAKEESKDSIEGSFPGAEEESDLENLPVPESESTLVVNISEEDREYDEHRSDTDEMGDSANNQHLCDLQLSDLALSSEKSQEEVAFTNQRVKDENSCDGGSLEYSSSSLKDDTGIFPSGNTDCEEEIVDPLSSSSIDISADKIQESVKNFFDGAIDSRIINSESTDSNRISDLPLSPSTASSLGGTDSDTNKLDSSLDAYTSDDTVVDKTSEEQSWSRVVHGENSTVTTESSNSQDDLTNQQEIEETGNAEDMQESEAKNGSSGSVSPSSSYVKCMIEEAMDDNASDTHSNGGEKSECSRSTGGHDSGDEISTTTSSDIEIISTPTPNGDGSKVVDLSPLRIALQKTANRGSLTHRRSDSQSTTSSRDGQCDQLSPGRETLDSMVDDANFSGERRLSQETDKSQRSELPPLSEERLDIQQQQKLQKKLAEMTEVLNARENKLVQLSKENHDLLESNSILRSQLQQVEEAREAELEDINKVTTEFTQRLSDSEKRVNQAIREKEAVKKQLQRAQEDLEKKIKDKSLQNLIKEKDQQIDELMQEGEKLSKQQLQVNTIIKKLRVKEKENETLITSQKKKLEDQKSELDHLRKVCESKDDLEKKQTEAIGQLNAAVQRQEREMSKLKSDHDDAQERVRGLQTALDNSYKEIADLHRSNAAQDSKAHEAALSAEMQVREELKIQLDHERKAFVQEKEALVMQIEDLRLTLSRMEKEHNRREDMLRQEISDLQRHLQEDEARNQDLTQSVTSATRPLLRQIENLQSTYAAQSQSWEKVEKNLSDRLVDAQAQLATAVEKERSATEAVMELRSKVTSLETQISCLKQDKTQLTAELDLLKTKLEVLEDAKNSDIAQLETAKQELTKGLAEIKKEKVFLETQLDMEKTKVDQEKKKFALAQDQISQLEREAQRPISRGSQSPLSISRTESISGEMPSMFTSFTQDDLERSFILSPNASKTSLYESMRHSGAASILENLQSQLKQREGEIVQLRNDIQQLERTRESMARELVNLTNQNEELQSQVEQLPQYKSKLEDVDSRYNALLQMYGEKVEEAEELRMDLQDVKEMYKAQIDHLLAK